MEHGHRSKAAGRPPAGAAELSATDASVLDARRSLLGGVTKSVAPRELVALDESVSGAGGGALRDLAGLTRTWEGSDLAWRGQAAGCAEGGGGRAGRG
jgi:hypothetical protein